MSYFSEIYGDLELSARAKLVLVYLHDRANKDGESWYAIGTMAKDLRLSRSTIKRALTELVRQGRVEKQARFRENGGCTSKHFVQTGLNRRRSYRLLESEASQDSSHV